MISAVVAAGGSGVRFGGDKTFARVKGAPLVYWTLARLFRLEDVAETVLVVPADRLEEVVREHGRRVERWGVRRIVAGGERRQDSVRRGLDACRADSDLVLVHDAVRPLFDLEAAREAVERARECGAAIVATRARDTLKRQGTEPTVLETVPRGDIWHAETPQVVRRDLLLGAYRAAEADGYAATDEASLVEHAGGTVALVRGAPWNVKVTEREDLRVVEALLAEELD